MARVFTLAGATKLGLPGRTALEIVAAKDGARSVTLRLVEIPPEGPGETRREAHHHADFEECTFVLSGTGRTVAANGEFALKPGDTLYVPAGETHVTRNTGTEPLRLLCFFPVADIVPGTEEPGAPPRGPSS